MNYNNKCKILIAITLLIFINFLIINGQCTIHSAPDDKSILIISTTLGLEDIAASQVGLNMVEKTPSEWRQMTPEDFGSYRALWLGDIRCPNRGIVNGEWRCRPFKETRYLSNIQAPVDTISTWAPMVKGNVVVFGGDPSRHGAMEVMRNLMNYIADSEYTGFFLATAKYYDYESNPVPVDVLQGFGSFTASSPSGSYDSAHIVAEHPVLQGLTDNQLTGWGDSVHNIFPSFPETFEVLAIGPSSPNHQAAMRFADGSVGIPYILARGKGLEPVGCSALNCPPETFCDGTNNLQCLPKTISVTRLELKNGYAPLGEPINAILERTGNSGNLKVILKTDDFQQTLESDFAFSNTFSWTFSSSVSISRSDYRLVFISKETPQVFAESNKFLIDDKEILSVHIPTKSYFRESSYMTISWSYQGIINLISIYLLHGISNEKTIASNIDPNQGSISWYVEATQGPSDDYMILVSADQYPEAQRASSNFEIDSKVISVSTPSSPYSKDEQVTVTVPAFSGNIGVISIKLLYEGRDKKTIRNSVDLSGKSAPLHFSWDVGTLPDSSRYQYFVQSLNYPSVEAKSKEFTIYGQPPSLQIETLPSYIVKDHILKIKWIKTGHVGKLNFFLFRNGNQLEKIASGISSGSWPLHWTATDPSNNYGSGFQIKVSSTVFNVEAFSKSFEISEKPKSLAFKSLPSYLVIGEIFPIVLQGTGISKVTLEIQSEGALLLTLATGVPMYHEWNTSTLGKPFGTKYYFSAQSDQHPEITAESEKFVLDIEDKTIEITLDSFNLSSQGYISPGEDLAISVETTGQSVPAELALYDENDNRLKDLFSFDSVNFNWQVNNYGASLGSNFYLKATSQEFTSIFGKTILFEIDEKSITLEPIDASYLFVGQVFQVTWQYEGKMEKGKLELFNEGNLEKTISSDVSIQDKHFDWKIDIDISMEKDFILKLSSLEYEVSDTQELTIDFEEKIIHVETPNHYLEFDTEYNIKWQISGTLRNIGLFLMNTDESKKITIVDNYDATNSPYTWYINSNETEPGTGYSFHITSNNYPEIVDTSDNFEIDILKSLNIKQSQNEYLVAGQKFSIQWENTGYLGICDIYMIHSHIKKAFLGSVECKDEQYQLNEVKPSDSLGELYSFFIESREYQNISDQTFDMEIDVEKTIFDVYVEPNLTFAEETIQICWNSTGRLDSLSISVWSSTSELYVINDSIHNNITSLEWQIPQHWNAFSDSLRIRVSSNQFSVSGMSNQFTISEYEPSDIVSIFVKQPPEYYIIGNEALIEWNTSFPMGTVSLNLIENDTLIESIVTGIDIEDGEYLWDIDPSIIPSDSYQIEMIFHQYLEMETVNSSLLEIDTEAKSLYILTPNSYLYNGMEYLIQWNDTGVTGPVKLQLYSMGTFHSLITPFVDGTSFLWNIHGFKDRDLNYSIQVAAINYPSVSDITSNFEIDVDAKNIKGNLEYVSKNFFVVGQQVTLRMKPSGYLGSVDVIQGLGSEFSTTLVKNHDPNDDFIFEIDNYNYPRKTNWQIVIRSSQYPRIEWQSREFEIDVEFKSITVGNIAPRVYNGYETRITWNTTGFLGPVKVELMKDDQVNLTLVDSTMNHYLNWKVKHIQEQGFDYHIRITSISYPFIDDFTESFEIDVEFKSIRGSIPYGRRNYFAVGDNATLFLQSTGYIGPVEVMLSRGDFMEELHPELLLDGSYEFDFEISLFDVNRSTEFQVEVLPLDYPEIEWHSREFEIDDVKVVSVHEITEPYLVEGSSYGIEWDTRGIVDVLSIDLYFEERYIAHIGTVNGCERYLSWNEVRSFGKLGRPQFYFHVHSIKYPTVEDRSNNFEIDVAKNLKLFDIEFEYVLKGSSLEVAWNSVGDVGLSSLYISDSRGITRELAEVDGNQDGYLWQIVDAFSGLGEKYSLILRSQKYNLSTQTSDMEIDVEKTIFDVYVEPNLTFAEEAIQICWNSTGRLDSLSISVWSSTSELYVINDSVHNNITSLEWQIPQHWNAFSDSLRIRVSSNRFSVSGMSNQFTISEYEPSDIVSIFVKQPPEYYIIGNEALIEWNTSFPMGTVSLNLIENDTLIESIVTGIDIEDGEYLWDIDPSIIPSDSYQIEMIFHQYLEMGRIVSNLFEIDYVKQINLRPLSTYYWIGSEIELEWNISGRMNVFMGVIRNQNGEGFEQELFSRLNDRNYSWPISDSISPNFSYYISVKSDEYEISSYSNTFDILERPNCNVSLIKGVGDDNCIMEGDSIDAEVTLSNIFLPAVVFLGNRFQTIELTETNNTEFSLEIPVLEHVVLDSMVHILVESEFYPEISCQSNEIEFNRYSQDIWIEVSEQQFWPEDELSIYYNISGCVDPLVFSLCNSELNPSCFFIIDEQVTRDRSSLGSFFNGTISRNLLDDHLDVNFTYWDKFYIEASSTEYLSLYFESNYFTIVPKETREINIYKPVSNSQCWNGLPLDITWTSNDIKEMVNMFIVHHYTNEILFEEDNLRSENILWYPQNKISGNISIIIESTLYPSIVSKRTIQLLDECPSGKYALSSALCANANFSLNGPPDVHDCTAIVFSIESNQEEGSIEWFWNITVENMLSTENESNLEQISNTIQNISIANRTTTFEIPPQYVSIGECLSIELFNRGIYDQKGATRTHSFCVLPFSESRLELEDHFITFKDRNTSIWAKNMLRQCGERDRVTISKIRPDSFVFTLRVFSRGQLSFIQESAMPLFVIEGADLEPYAEYELEYSIRTNSSYASQVSRKDYKTLEIHVHDLEIIIHPGDGTSVNVEKENILDASESFDPDSINAKEKFTWNCLNCSSPLPLVSSNPSIIIPANSLSSGEIYEFQLFYTKGKRESSRSIFIHTTKIGSGPVLSFNQNLSLSRDAMNPQLINRFRGQYNTVSDQFKWRMNNVELEMNGDILTSKLNPNLVLDQNTFEFNRTYSLEYISQNTQIFSKLDLKTALRIIPGNVYIKEHSQTGYLIYALDFLSRSHFPLQYSFWVSRIDNGKEIKIPISKGYTYASIIHTFIDLKQFSEIHVICRDSIGVKSKVSSVIKKFLSSNIIRPFKDNSSVPYLRFSRDFHDNDKIEEYWLTRDVGAILDVLSWSSSNPHSMNDQRLYQIIETITFLSDKEITTQTHGASKEIRNTVLIILSNSIKTMEIESSYYQYLTVEMIQTFIPLGFDRFGEAANILAKIISGRQISLDHLFFGIEILQKLMLDMILQPVVKGEMPHLMEASQNVVLWGWNSDFPDRYNVGSYIENLSSSLDIISVAQPESPIFDDILKSMIIFKKNILSSVQVKANDNDESETQANVKYPMISFSFKATKENNSYSPQIQFQLDNASSFNTQDIRLVCLRMELLSPSFKRQWTDEDCHTEYFDDTLKCTCNTTSTQPTNLFTVGESTIPHRISDSSGFLNSSTSSESESSTNSQSLEQSFSESFESESSASMTSLEQSFSESESSTISQSSETAFSESSESGKFSESESSIISTSSEQFFSESESSTNSQSLERSFSESESSTLSTSSETAFSESSKPSKSESSTMTSSEQAKQGRTGTQETSGSDMGAMGISLIAIFSSIGALGILSFLVLAILYVRKRRNRSARVQSIREDNFSPVNFGAWN